MAELAYDEYATPWGRAARDSTTLSSPCGLLTLGGQSLAIHVTSSDICSGSHPVDLHR